VFKQPTLSVVFRVSRIHQSGYVRNLYNLYIILNDNESLEDTDYPLELGSYIVI